LAQTNSEDDRTPTRAPSHVEYQDMRIMSGGDVAFIHALERFTGTLKNGQQSDFWLRATSGLRNINDKWLIIRDPVSVPVDFESGRRCWSLSHESCTLVRLGKALPLGRARRVTRPLARVHCENSLPL
jgi:hypothetical protein